MGKSISIYAADKTLKLLEEIEEVLKDNKEDDFSTTRIFYNALVCYKNSLDLNLPIVDKEKIKIELKEFLVDNTKKQLSNILEIVNKL